MKLYGSLSGFRDLLASFASILGTAGTNSASNHSLGVTVQSGDAAGTTSNSGNVIVKAGTATGTRGSLTASGKDVTVTADTALSLTGATVNIVQGGFTAGVVVPANATITLPAVTATVASTANISTHAGLTTTHGVSGAIVGTTDTQILTNKVVRGFGIAPIYSASATYAIGDVVTSTDGLSAYAALAAGTLGALTVPTDWQPIVQNGVSAATGGTNVSTCDCQLANTFTSASNANIIITMDHMRDGYAYNVYLTGANARTVAWTLLDKDSAATLTAKTGVTYSNTMTGTLSLFTLIRIGTTVVINSLHGIA